MIDKPPHRRVVVHKQQSYWLDAEEPQVPDLTISVVEVIRDDQGMQTYQEDAKAIVDALWDALPGGTIDQVLIQFMQRRASLFRVGYMSVQELAEVSKARAAAGAKPDHQPQACRGECDDHR